MNERYVVVASTAPQMHDATRELATRLAQGSRAVLVFLHIVSLQSRDGEAMLSASLRDHGGGERAWLQTLRPTDAAVPYRHRYEVGDPDDLVERFVASHAVAYVVAEEPPRSRLSVALWRSFAERLARRLPCPVVIGGPTLLDMSATRSPSQARPPTYIGLADLLNATVEARVAALRTWMDAAAEAARRVAGSAAVVDAARMARKGWLSGRQGDRLYVELDEHRRALGALGWRLVTEGHQPSDGVAWPEEGPALTEFEDRVRRRGASTSLPVRAGAHELVVVAGARVRDTPATLMFHYPAEAHFLRILGQPGPLPTFETYAFDTAGLMLSNSRFPDHLVAAGLLHDEGQQTPLRLRIAEPSEGPHSRWPLTRMAQAAALNHLDGFDTQGYPDYRGKPVVGAWRWVDDYGFGVAAEVDREEALVRA